MATKVNPIRRRGERNHLCPEYEACLDRVSREDWGVWSCSFCAFRQKKKPWDEPELYTHRFVDCYSLQPDIARRFS